MDKETSRNVKVNLNELSSEKSEQPEVKEFTNMVNNLLQYCDDNRIPIICLAGDSKTNVGILGVQGTPKHHLMLVIDLLKRAPLFEEVLRDALEYINLSKKAEERMKSFIRDSHVGKAN